MHKQIFFVSDDDLVRHQGEDIPFTTFVDLPGVKPGDGISITPLVEHVGFELIGRLGGDDCDESESSIDCSDPYVEEPDSPVFRRLIQRTVIQLIVRGSEEQAIRVATAPLPITAAAPLVTC